jgi:hypothetical protein
MDRGRETDALLASGGTRAFFLARPAALLRTEGMTMLFGSALLYWCTGGVGGSSCCSCWRPTHRCWATWPGLGSGRQPTTPSTPTRSRPFWPPSVSWAVPPWPVLGLSVVRHIGMDRTIGYGLKYPTAFGDTHLGRV